jgi:hypothetical protein
VRFGSRGQLAVGGNYCSAARPFLPVIPTLSSLNQSTSWSFCDTFHTNVGAQTTKQPQYQNIVNHLHVVLVLFSSSLDHISGPSSSLLFSTDPAWHIVFGGLRFFSLFHRFKSNPENSFKGVCFLFTADIFCARSHSLLTRYCARAALDGALFGIILLKLTKTQSEL